METLNDLIQMFEASDYPVPEFPEDHVIPCGLVERAVGYATALFVSEEGKPEYDKMEEFEKTYKYQIFPMERDRFGWLTAGIQTKKGIIVFG